MLLCKCVKIDLENMFIINFEFHSKLYKNIKYEIMPCKQPIRWHINDKSLSSDLFIK